MNAWLSIYLGIITAYAAACGTLGSAPNAPLWLRWPQPIWNRIAHDWRRPQLQQPRPDYAKIDRLERELGIVDPPRPGGIIRRVERDGEVIEIRTWGV